jgi:hypothetical protein
VLVSLAVGILLMSLMVKPGAASSEAKTAILIVIFYGVAVRVIQPHSETVSTLAGSPVDERWGLIQGRALEAAAFIGATVALVAFAATNVMGVDNWQFAFIAGAIGLGYAAGVIWYRWRL